MKVRYIIHIDNGESKAVVREYHIERETHSERMAAAGNAALASKMGFYPEVVNGVLYPAHRIREITWEIL